jgi:hypothetical protein
MSRQHESFVDLCLKGRETPAAIDDYIDRWHEGDEECSLAEFLGFTPEEYACYVADPASLSGILLARGADRALTPAKSRQSKAG